jgi:hypothetical protein
MLALHGAGGQPLAAGLARELAVGWLMAGVLFACLPLA